MNSLDRFFCLSPIERAAHYRELADLMRSRATSAITKDTHDGYLVIATQWLDMAEKLEAEHGKTRVIVQSKLAWQLHQGALLARLCTGSARNALCPDVDAEYLVESV